jgi:hypothetical protein
MEPLLSRILIQKKDGAIIAYLYNRESFNLLKIEKQKYDNSQFIETGQIIEYDGNRYKVIELNLKLEEKLYKINPKVGFTMYSPTDPSDYNSQIGVFVEDID